MKAVIVYESLWGNTAAVARAVAEGFGPSARAVTTDEATEPLVAEADVIVAGAPVIAFSLASDKTRNDIARAEKDAPTPPDTSHPSLKTWLASLPAGHGRAAAFETRLWWSPRGAVGTIEKGLKQAGYAPIAKPGKFVVDGKYGPLREGELERARRWGHELAVAVGAGARD
jgi:flavorubredoxin